MNKIIAEIEKETGVNVKNVSLDYEYQEDALNGKGMAWTDEIHTGYVTVSVECFVKKGDSPIVNAIKVLEYIKKQR